MRVPCITKFAFLAFLFCLLNIFTSVFSNENVSGIYNETKFLDITQDHNLLNYGNNETSFLENSAVDNNYTTGFDVNPSKILPHENNINQQKLTDATVVTDIPATETQNPIDSLTTKSYNNQKSVVGSNKTSIPDPNIGSLSIDTSKTDLIKQIRIALYKCHLDSFSYRLKWLHDTNVENLKMSNQSDHDSILSNTFTQALNFYTDMVKSNEKTYQEFTEKFCKSIPKIADKSSSEKISRNSEEGVKLCISNGHKIVNESNIDDLLQIIFNHFEIEKILAYLGKHEKFYKHEKLKEVCSELELSNKNASLSEAEEN